MFKLIMNRQYKDTKSVTRGIYSTSINIKRIVTCGRYPQAKPHKHYKSNHPWGLAAPYKHYLGLEFDSRKLLILYI